MTQPNESVPAGQAAPAVEGEEAGHGREGFVEMTPARLEASGLRTSTVEEGSIASEIIAKATVTAPPKAHALPTARAARALVRTNTRLGARVRAGASGAPLAMPEA